MAAPPMSPALTNHSTIKLWQILGYMGLLPFVVCITASHFISDVQMMAKQAFVYYSAIILSFIAGSLWRVEPSRKMGKEQLVSNFFSLIAFFSLLSDLWLALWMLATSYLLILLFERSLNNEKAFRKEYMSMRVRLTTIVVMLHAFALFFWL